MSSFKQMKSQIRKFPRQGYPSDSCSKDLSLASQKWGLCILFFKGGCEVFPRNSVGIDQQSAFITSYRHRKGTMEGYDGISSIEDKTRRSFSRSGSP